MNASAPPKGYHRGTRAPDTVLTDTDALGVCRRLYADAFERGEAGEHCTAAKNCDEQ